MSLFIAIELFAYHCLVLKNSSCALFPGQLNKQNRICKNGAIAIIDLKENTQW
jgi:hypothetical protein